MKEESAVGPPEGRGDPRPASRSENKGKEFRTRPGRGHERSAQPEEAAPMTNGVGAGMERTDGLGEIPRSGDTSGDRGWNDGRIERDEGGQRGKKGWGLTLSADGLRLI